MKVESSTLSCFLIVLIFCRYFGAGSADSSPLQDTCPTATHGERALYINGFPCKNPTTVMASDFKTSALSHAGDLNNFFRSSVNLITAAEFPGLNILGLSVARTDLAVDGVVLPHSHPRASEMFYVSRGIVIAVFVDTGDRLFQKILGEGDVFMFPRGLLHFCLNAGYGLATVFSVLNSQNPGVVTIAGALFSPHSVVSDRLVTGLLSLRAVGNSNATTGMERLCLGKWYCD